MVSCAPVCDTLSVGAVRGPCRRLRRFLVFDAERPSNTKLALANAFSASPRGVAKAADNGNEARRRINNMSGFRILGPTAACALGVFVFLGLVADEVERTQESLQRFEERVRAASDPRKQQKINPNPP